MKKFSLRLVEALLGIALFCMLILGGGWVIRRMGYRAYIIFMLVFGVGATGLLAWRGALRLVRMSRVSHRMMHGECPRCGYSLRATPDRCPECGMVQSDDQRSAAVSEALR